MYRFCWIYIDFIENVVIFSPQRGKKLGELGSQASPESPKV